MKKAMVLCFATFMALQVGCAANVAVDEEPGLTTQAMTLAQCADQRDACIDDMGLLGLIFCNMDYTLCTATADNGLPAEVIQAASDVAQCTAELDDCVFAAETPTQLALCAEAEAQCVADILDVQLPTIVSGTAACVDGAVECINEAQSVTDLTGCGETMAICAVDEAAGVVIPDEVAETVENVLACTAALDDCILTASTPSELTACAEQEALCVSESLGVELPEVPVSEVVGCAETAADCTLETESVSDLLGCTDGLIDCAQAVADSLEVPEIIDCNVAWTTCMFQNPFAFIQCANELRECQQGL